MFLIQKVMADSSAQLTTRSSMPTLLYRTFRVVFVLRTWVYNTNCSRHAVANIVIAAVSISTLAPWYWTAAKYLSVCIRMHYSTMLSYLAVLQRVIHTPCIIFWMA